MSESQPQPRRQPPLAPAVVRNDARFKAGRKLVESGHPGIAVDVFATLLQETIRACDGDERHVETVPAYYEYGNALLRHVQRQQDDDEVLLGGQQQDEEEGTETAAASAAGPGDSSDNGRKRRQQAAAAAAERRAAAAAAAAGATTEAAATKPATAAASAGGGGGAAAAGDQNGEGESAVETNEEYDEDLDLALEMMMVAYSILDEALEGEDEEEGGEEKGEEEKGETEADQGGDAKGESKYRDWLTEQRPRILVGLGDALACRGRRADAVEAYLRALEFRRADCDEAKKVEAGKGQDMAALLQAMKRRRLYVEANALIAETLLACPEGEDVVTTETGTKLVDADERVDYARGYCDKAREELQDLLLFYGQVVASLSSSSAAASASRSSPSSSNKKNGNDESEQLANAKQDIVFVSSLVAGVATALAVLDEEQQRQEQDGRRATKKLKSK